MKASEVEHEWAETDEVTNRVYMVVGVPGSIITLGKLAEGLGANIMDPGFLLDVIALAGLGRIEFAIAASGTRLVRRPVPGAVELLAEKAALADKVLAVMDAVAAMRPTEDEP